MAEVDPAKTPSLAEDYLLEGKDKTPQTTINPVEEADVKTPLNTAATEEVVEKIEEAPAVTENTEAVEAAGSESTESVPSVEPTNEDVHAASEEVSESAKIDSSADQEADDETPEIKLETAPADFRFPTTNQSRHCFTRYIEYHRCIAAKGDDDALECQKFAKYYRSLCPGEWIDRWNEQRENGTFPGPL